MEIKNKLKKLQQLRFAYAGLVGAGVRSVVQDVSLSMAPGELHCLLGRSGCGKTTVLKLAAGLLQPQAGQVMLQGRVVTKPEASMGFVFQAPGLLPWLNVLDNVLLPIALHRKPGPQDKEKAAALLHTMGLGALQGQRPQHLSGGQQSRVAIARALVTSPQILFMDEPFAALDAITREELQRDFLTLCHAQGTSVLFVTHDISEAVFLADRVSVMHAGRMGTPLSVALPRQREVALRYTPEFNACCAQLRQAMDGAAA